MLLRTETSLGIEQLETPWSDGTPGLAQRPVDEGALFRYRWTAHQYGAYFYHAHHRGQLEDGLYGPIYVTPSSSEEKPFNLITTDQDQLQAISTAEANTSPIILSDWRLVTSEEIWSAEEASGVDAYCANALLINGKGSVSCFSRTELDAITTAHQQAALGNESLTDIGLVRHMNLTDSLLNWLKDVSLPTIPLRKVIFPMITTLCFHPCFSNAHPHKAPTR